MKKNYFVHLTILMAFLLVQVMPGLTNLLYSQDVITHWDFEGDVLTPSIGEGIAENIGNTSSAFASGNGGGRGWNTSSYPEQSTNSGEAGVQFLVSTLGYQNIVIDFDHRSSGTASRWAQIHYTTDGTSWQVLDNNEGGLSPHDVFYVFSFDFTGVANVSNNPNFGIRIVSIFSPFAFNQNETLSYGADEAYMRSNAQATYPPDPGSGTGNYGPAGTWRFDNVTFSGDEITGSNAVKLAIISVNGGVSPTVNFPFEVVVQAQDADGLPANLTTNTTITLTKETGAGTLGGTLVITLLAGSHTLPFDNVTYNVADSDVKIKASATAGMTLTPGISDPFEVLEAATQLKFVDVPGNGVVNQPIGSFTVEARRPDNSVDNTYSGTITLTRQSGPGNISGTTVADAVQGVATFSDISFDATGTYTLNASASNLTPDVSPSITIIGAPAISSVILPQYISGAEPIDNRLPFAFRASFSNLFPNSTYKYINQAVISGDSPTSNGAGNLLFITSDGQFNRTTSPSFTTPGAFGEFETDQNGNFTGWFILEPTGNARFTPGNYVFMRIRLNDGSGGTSVANYLTLADSIHVIGFSPDPDPNFGTGIRANSFSSSKNFALLYDNVPGDGRPIFGTSIETTGIDFTQITQYAQFYREDVSGFDGAWGGIVPNVLPNGIQRIEERKLSDGGIQSFITSVNGMWYNTNTVNPSGGIDNILVIDLTTNIPKSDAGVSFTVYTTSDQIVIQSPTEEIISVQITNLLGRQMQNGKFSGNSVYYLSHQLKTGIYIVNVTNAKGVFNTKIFVR